MRDLGIRQRGSKNMLLGLMSRNLIVLPQFSKVFIVETLTAPMKQEVLIHINLYI